jgi:hypothetical protein
LKECDNLRSAPYLVNTVAESSKLLKFLTDWVLRPQVEDLTRVDLEMLISDLEGWKQGDPLEGGQSLNDFYMLLDRAVRDLEGAETTIDKLHREHRDNPRRAETKNRTRMVTLWRGCRHIILGGWQSMDTKPSSQNCT